MDNGRLAAKYSQRNLARSFACRLEPICRWSVRGCSQLRGSARPSNGDEDDRSSRQAKPGDPHGSQPFGQEHAGQQDRPGGVERCDNCGDGQQASVRGQEVGQRACGGGDPAQYRNQRVPAGGSPSCPVTAPMATTVTTAASSAAASGHRSVPDPARLRPMKYSPNVAPDTGARNSLLFGVSSLSASQAWAVGYYDTPAIIQQTLVLHWDGSRWTQVPSPNPGGQNNSALADVSARSSSDAWAVGNIDSAQVSELTLVLHWNGTSWSQA